MSSQFKQWNYVSSSWVEAIYYDDDTRELSVEFKDGAVCTYGRIDPEDALDFLDAPSKGRWVWRNLYHLPYR